MKKILFQGDSITDTWRDGKTDYHFGFGYATLVTSKIGNKYPGEYDFSNKGISGNRIVDLYARIKSDIINLKPDYMSILIGINDVWHEVVHKNGVENEKFKKIYCMLIEEIKEALPDIKIMILEPFVLKSTATEENWDIFYKETKLRGEAAKSVAEKYNLTFVPLQDKFNSAMKKYNDALYWTKDGVHPTNAGHQIIAEEWEKTFEKLL